MKSTTTRFTASVIAIAIPFAPSVAHAETKPAERPAYQRQQAEHLTADIAAASVKTSSATLTAQQKLVVGNAIESAHTAALQALTAYESVLLADEYSIDQARERLVHSRVALDAAAAEARSARDIVPANATTLAAALDAIIFDLEALLG